MQWIELLANLFTVVLGPVALWQFGMEIKGIKDGKRLEVYSKIFSSLIKSTEKSGVIAFDQLYKSPRDFSEKFTEYMNELKGIVYPATEMFRKEQDKSDEAFYEQNEVWENYEDNENEPIDELLKQEIMEQIEKEMEEDIKISRDNYSTYMNLSDDEKEKYLEGLVNDSIYLLDWPLRYKSQFLQLKYFLELIYSELTSEGYSYNYYFSSFMDKVNSLYILFSGKNGIEERYKEMISDAMQYAKRDIDENKLLDSGSEYIRKAEIIMDYDKIYFALDSLEKLIQEYSKEADKLMEKR